MKQLEQDMASMMGHAAKESGTTDNEGFESAVNQGADAFTKQLEESGVPPGDFLKQLLSDVMAEEGSDKPPAAPGAGAADSQAAGSSTAPPSGGGDGAAPESFNDTIQRTIHRMQESGDKATAAATDDSDDLVAQLLKAVEAGAGAGDDGDLNKMFMGMMEQLSNKEMLYEPMKELDGKFGPWLAENRGKVAAEDMARYEKQATVVSQIVGKFEEDGYTDKDAKCRDYVWERMQEVCVLSLCRWNRLTGLSDASGWEPARRAYFESAHGGSQRAWRWSCDAGLSAAMRRHTAESDDRSKMSSVYSPVMLSCTYHIDTLYNRH